MVKITKLNVLKNHHIHFYFDDGMEKTVDFSQFISDAEMTKPLKDEKYFCKVKIYENGRGIFWPNGYDFCPDNIRYYLVEEENLHLKKFSVHDKPNK